MKKYGIAGVLILLAGIAGFWFPSALLEWQDRARIGNVETEDAEEVILTVQTELSLSEKLKLMTGGTTSAMAMSSGKNYSRETIEAKMQEEVRKLEELGVLDLNGKQSEYSGAEVCFLVDTENGSRSLLLWVVSGSTEDYELELTMDDETGKILNVQQNFAWEKYTTESAVSTVMDVSEEAVWEENYWSDWQKIAEGWGEYLGCTLTETYRSQTELLCAMSEYEEEMEQEVKDLVKTGFSEEDAYRKVYEAWGYWEELSGEQFFAAYQDEKESVIYRFRASVGNVVFSAEIFM